MTTLAVPSTAPAARRPRTAVRPVTFGRLLAAEWVKFRSLRSTPWALGVALVLMVGLAALQAWGTSNAPSDMGAMAGISGAVYVTGGSFLAVLVFCVLGVLAITGEYTTGQIRSTLTSAPQRVPVLLAKLVVVVTAVLVVSALAVGLSWAVASPWFDDLGVSVDLGDASDLRILGGTALYLATATALAFAIGALVRHSAAGLAIVLGLLLVVENVFALVPWRPFELVSPFLPATAGGRLTMDDATRAMVDAGSEAVILTPWQGYGVMVAWVVVLLAVAAVLLRRRDA